jgi:hypothetical protein
MNPLVRCLLLGALLSNPIFAKHWHEDDDHWNKHSHHDDDDRDFDHRAGNCYFGPGEVRVISEYYGPHSRNLPPGLQKKLYRTGHLPPGWQKRMQPFPVVVEQQLAPVPVGYSRGFIDGYAVVYNPRTQIIVDITAVFH